MNAQALSTDDLTALLETTPSLPCSLISTLPAVILVLHLSAGAWCVHEILGHMSTRLGDDTPQLVNWDQVAAARTRDDCTRDVNELLDEFQSLRAQSVSLVRGLQAADLERGGYHVEIGYITVRDLLHEWVYHDQIYLQQAMANLRECLWPQLEPVMHFSN